MWQALNHLFTNMLLTTAVMLCCKGFHVILLDGVICSLLSVYIKYFLIVERIVIFAA